MRKSCAIILFFFFTHSIAMAIDRVIFSVSKDIPMGFDNEIIRTNYYVNIGTNQGVKNGTLLDVFRIISKQNPYDNKKRVNYKVKIGELKVLHSEENAAIAMIENKSATINDPILEVEGFMIGDNVSVNVEK